MKAIIRYGKFIQVIDVNKVEYTIAVTKPIVMGLATDKPIDTSVIEPHVLEFRLKKDPEIGTPLEYEFTGEV